MSEGPGLRRYLPAAIAVVVIVALVVLSYFAGYRAGRGAAVRTHRATAPLRP